MVDIHNNTSLEYLTVEPTAGSAIVEYISFTVDEGDAPIASFSLTEEFDGEAGSERDIFSIDDLSISAFTDAYSFLPGEDSDVVDGPDTGDGTRQSNHRREPTQSRQRRRKRRYRPD